MEKVGYVGVIVRLSLSGLWLYNFINYSVLLGIVFTFFTVQRLPAFNSVFVIDLLILLYVFISAFCSFIRGGRVGVMLFTGKVILFFFLVLMPALFLMIFSKNINESLLFVSQYCFIFSVLPLFMNYLIVNRHLVIFMRMVFLGFIMVFVLFIFAFFYPLIIWSDYILSDESGGDFFGFRFFLGEFTPNEMGHYFVMFILSLFFLKDVMSKNIVKFSVIILSLFTFVLTMSKTVWLQIICSFFVVENKKFKVFFLVSFILVIFSFYFLYNDFFISLIKDFSFDNSNNQIRVEMFFDSIEYLPYSILHPAFHSPENLVLQGVHVTSAHNGLLSFMSNFGLISFMILFFGFAFFLVNKVNQNNRVFLFLVLIDLIVWMFNPLINARHVWLPIVSLLFMIQLNKDYPVYRRGFKDL